MLLAVSCVFVLAGSGAAHTGSGTEQEAVPQLYIGSKGWCLLGHQECRRSAAADARHACSAPRHDAAVGSVCGLALLVVCVSVAVGWLGVVGRVSAFGHPVVGG